MNESIRKLPPLTTREREIAMLIAQDFTSRTIARTLKISQGTVEKHRSSICLKIGRIAAVTRFCMREGLIS